MKVVTCIYCREKFDIDIEDYVRVGKRYAHKNCAEKRGKKNNNSNVKKDKKICLYCGEYLDITKDDFVKPQTNRYAHLKCYEQYKKTDEYYKDLIYDFLKNRMKIDYNYTACERQRLSYIKKLKYTNKEIYEALQYFYLIKKGSPKTSNGRIGIVPYVHDEAVAYFNNIEQKKTKIIETIQHQKNDKKDNIEIIYDKKNQNRNKIDLNSIL